MTENNMEQFEKIQPYTDEEAVAAFARIARHPVLPVISKYLFPALPSNAFRHMILSVKSVEEFQEVVMSKCVASVVNMTTSGVTYEGIEKLKNIDGRFLAVSNHRDIILDPAITQWLLHMNCIPMTEICVGSNLLSSPLVEDLLRSNRMIKVIRGISARELYLSSQTLSKYIRRTITSGRSSVWVAQREGRTKDGLDTTEQGLLKMFDLSGEASFSENFEALNIVPISISYEYEPCDSRKARELLIKRNTGSYKKKPKEDLHSILTGIRQKKGRVHLSFGDPLTHEEIELASQWNGNDRYQAIRHVIDERVRKGYRLFKTNYMGYDLMNGSKEFLGDKYTREDLDEFVLYVEHKLGKVERKLDKVELHRIFYEIYGNPVKSKLGL